MGKICMGDDNVVALLVNYYQESFSSSTLGDMESTLQWVPHVVTDDMNSILMGNFSKQEVDFALKQMALLKALDMTVCFLFFFSNTTGKSLERMSHKQFYLV